MATYAQIARAHLGNLGKVSLGFYPTPFHKLESISSAYDVNLWIKREDFSGSTLFGGNKIRKLEYLLHDAKDQGCDTVFTYGATQSNHVMETATAARRCGMRPVVYLGAIVEPQPNDVRANLLLDTILGAEIHILPSCGRSTKETMEANDHLFQAHIAQLAAQGHKVYNIPIGGSTPIGAAGFAECYIETMEQCESAGLACDYLVTATGSGGTLAGLAAGAAMLHDDSTQLIGILRPMAKRSLNWPTAFWKRLAHKRESRRFRLCFTQNMWGQATKNPTKKPMMTSDTWRVRKASSRIRFIPAKPSTD